MKYILFMFINMCLLCLSLCDDQQYEVCRKRRVCGNQSIEYPFYISHQQGAFYCGYPGFELGCINDSLVLNISADPYIVDQISYTNYSLHLSSAFSLAGDFCSLAKIRNLTFPVDHRFELNSSSSLVLLSNCSSNGQGLLPYKIGCNQENSDSDSVLAMNLNDPNISLGIQACKSVVVAPVADHNEDYDNKLELLRDGFVLKWRAANCTDCQLSGGYCGYDSLSDVFMCFCSDRPHSRSCIPRKSKHFGLKIGAASGAAGATILILLLILLLYISCRQRNTEPDSSLFPRNASSYPKDVKAFLRQYETSTPKRFRYSTIKNMTSSFKDELGKGGYGTVYKGCLSDARIVAVKVLNAAKGNGEEFLNEVASIGRTSHVNVVKLVGFCYEGKKRALIYDYMPNGSLEKAIYGKDASMEGQHLGWEKLYSIALGIARGLDYLHRGCNTRILHFDIKPHNILLDEHFRPKISDFGLAKLYNENESNVSSTIQARGTIGYIAPEVFSRNIGQVSHKSDVYSYGMMVLEMVGGQKNVHAGADHTSEIYYPRWLYKRIASNEGLYFGSEMSEEETEIARKMVIVGLWCIQMNPVQRPDINKVIEMLEAQITSLEKPPKPYMCSPTDSPSNSQSRPHFILSSVTDSDSSRETASRITTA